MDLTTILQEIEMELKRLAANEEGDNKKKILALKAKEEKYFDFDEKMMLIVQNLRIFMNNEKQ